MAPAPFVADDYPGLLQRYRRLWAMWGVLTIIIVIGPAWSVLALRLTVENAVYLAWLDTHCELCLARFHDLQAYDGVSGQSYLVVVPSFLVLTALFYSATLFAYVKARHVSRSHRPMRPGSSRLVVQVYILIGVLIFVIIFLPTELSQGRYPGGTRLLAGYTYPVLAAFCSGGVAISLLQISVFCLKALRY